MNHGASCTAFLPHNQHEQTPNRQSEVYLRQFSAAGGSIVRSAHGTPLRYRQIRFLTCSPELPANADIIIDALLDNEANVKRPPTQPDSSIPDAISWALSCTKSGSNTQSPQWSIDLPSNTDANTGYPSPGAIWVVSPRAVVALGFVKAPSANARYNLYLVDMGIPLVRNRIDHVSCRVADQLCEITCQTLIRRQSSAPASRTTKIRLSETLGCV